MAVQERKTRGAPRGSRAASQNGAAISEADLSRLLDVLKAARDGDFSQRMSTRKAGVVGEIAATINAVLETSA